jgi:hypothetical protein
MQADVQRATNRLLRVMEQMKNQVPEQVRLAVGDLIGAIVSSESSLNLKVALELEERALRMMNAPQGFPEAVSK